MLVVGGGGREHALCWRLAQDPTVTRVLAAPGNAGIAASAECFPSVATADVEAMVNLVDQQAVDLTVIGPEVPLVAGMADVLRSRGHAVFGPSAAAARIEGSKAYAKEIMARAGVATARSRPFHPGDEAAAMSFVRELGGHAVVKEDGLAAGKGVTLVERAEAAEAEIYRLLIGGPPRPRSSDWLVEEVLEGPEISAFALCDGERIVPLGLCQDQKRAWVDGPMTGGMGAYSPLAWVAPEVEASIWDDVMRPVVGALADVGAPFVGVLFAGLMLTPDGIKVLEFNCRFGDPEAEALLPRLRSSLVDALVACAEGDISGTEVTFDDASAVTVVMCNPGYPGDYVSGGTIQGLDRANDLDGVTVFHAGTALNAAGEVVTAGGRVLAVTGLDPSLERARELAYLGVSRIQFGGAFVREDIAATAMEGAQR